MDTARAPGAGADIAGLVEAGDDTGAAAIENVARDSSKPTKQLALRCMNWRHDLIEQTQFRYDGSCRE